MYEPIAMTIWPSDYCVYLINCFKTSEAFKPHEISDFIVKEAEIINSDAYYLFFE